MQCACLQERDRAACAYTETESSAPVCRNGTEQHVPTLRGKAGRTEENVATLRGKAVCLSTGTGQSSMCLLWEGKQCACLQGRDRAACAYTERESSAPIYKDGTEQHVPT
ncbi:hypothetical protein NDU88_006852 [Pleurodeles waltl]|uniref:Uncharacterized protein n=1 Tax=Pleurodeles waltl TaxID=8319 RepID=A0AAV7WBY0_PLEWA|nr:hypothetical protein NDU88_006852 [Pleurodeles waltl]